MRGRPPPISSATSSTSRWRHARMDGAASPASDAPAEPEIAVDALLVQPFEEEDDWDFGQRRLGLQAFASYDLGHGWSASAYVHLQHREGPNLLFTGSAAVHEDRLWLRA